MENGYDRLAIVYRWLEWFAFGRQLMRARVMLLDELVSHDSLAGRGWGHRFLLLGDGDGRLLVELQKRFADAEFVSIDSSKEMLRAQRAAFDSSQGLASGRKENAGTLQLIHEDATTYQFEGPPCDVLVMAFFLDCFTSQQVEQCLPIWLDQIGEDGLVYFVDFVQPQSGWKKIYGGLVLWGLHLFFSRFTALSNQKLTPMGSYFENLNWKPIHEKRLHAEVMVARIYRRA